MLDTAERLLRLDSLHRRKASSWALESPSESLCLKDDVRQLIKMEGGLKLD